MKSDGYLIFQSTPAGIGISRPHNGSVPLLSDISASGKIADTLLFILSVLTGSLFHSLSLVFIDTHGVVKRETVAVFIGHAQACFVQVFLI